MNFATLTHPQHMCDSFMRDDAIEENDKRSLRLWLVGRLGYNHYLYMCGLIVWQDESFWSTINHHVPDIRRHCCFSNAGVAIVCIRDFHAIKIGTSFE